MPVSSIAACVLHYLDAAGDGVDDVGRVVSCMVHGEPEQDHGIVVVPAEGAEQEQGPGQVVLAALPSRRRAGAADGRQQVPEPLDLDVHGAVVPDRVADADGLEELEVQGRGGHDGHARAPPEVGAVLLRRREQRQPQLLSCICM